MPAFALAIFTGAFLLFQIQPLIGKYILPWFGGSPGVWTTCMLFFQVLLLGGYAYAHTLSRRLAPRSQVVVHLTLLAAALVTLPIIPGDSWKPLADGDPVWRILALLTATLGLPYLVLAATGPLMQEWFRRSSPGVSPYRLYALSNVGSLLALVSYPLLFETFLTRQEQARFWSWGLVAYAAACVWCGRRVWRLTGAERPTAAAAGTAASAMIRAGHGPRDSTATAKAIRAASAAVAAAAAAAGVATATGARAPRASRVAARSERTHRFCLARGPTRRATHGRPPPRAPFFFPRAPWPI